MSMQSDYNHQAAADNSRNLMNLEQAMSRHRNVQVETGNMKHVWILEREI
jgi:hypothetical protein